MQVATEVKYRLRWIQHMPGGKLSRSSSTSTWTEEEYDELNALCERLNMAWNFNKDGDCQLPIYHAPERFIVKRKEEKREESA